MGTPIPQEGEASNRYTILGRLAGGGMADILLAKATSVGGVERYVVLKRVLPERSRDPTFARMFLDEARLASQLHHPNIAQVYDIGKLAGSYFFTMEYVHGEDVRSLLNRLAGLERRLPTNNALYIAAGALAALHHAHERVGTDGTSLGIVHRDVSPSNVMVSYEGVVKLLDFGVAKAAQRSAETKSGTIKGKIAYLSPEQCKGAAVDRRSDIFSLGVVLYETLTSRRLFKRDTDFATMMAIVNDDIPPPSAIRDDVTPDLDKVVMTALRKDPDQRYATAADMLEAIESLAGSEHQVMSATTTGRFLRDLFGERPEPWMEIKVRGDEPKAITITGESIHESDVLSDAGLATLGTGRFADEPEDGLEVETQIHETPALWRADHGETSPAVNAVPILPKQAESRNRPVTGKTIPARPRAPTDDNELDTDEAPAVRLVAPMDTQPEHNFASVTATTVTPMMAEPTTERDARAPASAARPPALAAPPPMMVPAPVYPVAAAYPSASGLTSMTKLVPDLRPASSRAIVIVVAAVVTLGIVLLVVKLASGGDSQPEPAAAAVVEDARVVAVDPPPPPADAAPPRVAKPPVTPPVQPPPVVRHEPSITELVDAKDYAGALRACAARKPKPTERTSCGIAACNLNQRAVALQYDKPASPAIEHACKAKNIVLAPPPAPPVAPHPPPATPHPPTPPPPPTPPHPPPAHPPDCEADPLKCQK